MDEVGFLSAVLSKSLMLCQLSDFSVISSGSHAVSIRWKAAQFNQRALKYITLTREYCCMTVWEQRYENKNRGICQVQKICRNLSVAEAILSSFTALMRVFATEKRKHHCNVIVTILQVRQGSCEHYNMIMLVSLWSHNHAFIANDVSQALITFVYWFWAN